MPLLVDHKLRGKSERQLFQLLCCAAGAKLPSLSELQFLHLSEKATVVCILEDYDEERVKVMGEGGLTGEWLPVFSG